LAKKNKSDILKRRLKSKKKSKKRRKLHQSHSGSEAPGPSIRYRPGISELGAPPGFRSVSMSQATMEYAKPLLELADSKGRDINEAVQTSIVLWNLAITMEEKKIDPQLEGDILKTLGKSFKMEKEEAKRFMDMMVERKNYLFPPEMQPKDRLLPFMFMRKEVRYLISPFDYSKLKISEVKIPPDRQDEALIGQIRKLDQFMEAESDWEDVEDLSYKVQDAAENRFRNWLTLKGISEDAERFASCLSIFFDFVYGYMHDDVVLLKSVGWTYWKEFFEDYLVRKVIVEKPTEYMDWVPALKLFYRFLHEKGYLEDPTPMFSLIDQVEPDFIDVLRKQFS
jgi:hypothetical protein